MRNRTGRSDEFRPSAPADADPRAEQAIRERDEWRSICGFAREELARVKAERDEARAELAALKAQEPVAWFWIEDGEVRT
jgi:hypothetical protein